MNGPLQPHSDKTNSCAEREQIAYNRRIDGLRRVEYPMLGDNIYLDHAGTTLPSKSLITTFSQQMQSQILGNPHSSFSSNPSLSHKIVEETRLKVLSLFRADPLHFDVVFVANATAGIKLLLEAFTGNEDGFDYYYHRDSHTSLVGVRELATRSHCFMSDDEVENWMAQKDDKEGSDEERLKLFAYPGQSNMNGRRLPLSWPTLLRSTSNHPRTYTLLDAAALVSTSPLSLANATTAPDFVVLSFYKIFGFPNLGALIVRKSAGHVFDNRKYFGGGTTGMITCNTKPWMVRKETTLSGLLEDGTGATHNILALSCAIDAHNKLFGGLGEVSKHTGWLSKRLYDGLEGLHHFNGKPLCQIYKDHASTYGENRTQGATVAFNICSSDGTWIASTTVGRIAAERNIQIRTGGMCNPGGFANALGLSDDDVHKAWHSGFRCGQEQDTKDGMPLGMVRASLGAMSTMRDVDVFLAFMEECFIECRSEATWSVGGSQGKQFDEKDEEKTERLSKQSSIPSIPRARFSLGRAILKFCLPSSSRDQRVRKL